MEKEPRRIEVTYVPSNLKWKNCISIEQALISLTPSEKNHTRNGRPRVVTAYTNMPPHWRLIGSGQSKPNEILTDGVVQDIRTRVINDWVISQELTIEQVTYVAWRGRPFKDSRYPQSTIYIQTTLSADELRKQLEGVAIELHCDSSFSAPFSEPQPATA